MKANTVTTASAGIRLLGAAVIGALVLTGAPAAPVGATPELGPGVAVGMALPGGGIRPEASDAGPAITSDPTDATISRYGTRTSTTFRVRATGTDLRYSWQRRGASEKKWKTIAAAKAAKYTAKAGTWTNGTRFRVIVTGKGGKVVSAPAKLTVLYPSKTPARDAEKAFGLSGLRQGVDLSAYQYTPQGRVKVPAVAAWAGNDGFVILRNGSGARPIKQKYTDACTNGTGKTGAEPVTEDCAYARLAPRARAAGLSLGHYWFNGWISSADSTAGQLFAGGYTPSASAAQFVAWLKRDGTYTPESTDPLVLDIEAGHAWTKTKDGRKVTRTLRAWNPAEATEFLTTVKALLTADGYQANLYVYMSANRTKQLQGDGRFSWQDVAGIARLWVAGWGTNNGRIPDVLPDVGPWAVLGGWSIWQYTSNARIAGDGVGALDGDIAKPDAWTPR